MPNTKNKNTKKRTSKKSTSASKRYLKPRWSWLSQSKKGIMYIDGISVTDLINKYGTPLYVVVERELRSRLRRFKSSFPYPNLRPQYACKCNSNLEIMRIAREEGFELDASSVGEIILALLADFKPHEITFTNLYKTEQDIMFAAKVGVQAITVDSIEEIKRVAAVGEKVKTKIRLFIRVNPMIEFRGYTTKNHKYGIPYGVAKKAIDIAINSPNIDLIGLHFHGSNMDYPKSYYLGMGKLLRLAKYCKEKGVTIRFVDMGGGFPVQYNNENIYVPEDMGKIFVRKFLKLLDKYQLEKPVLVFEPGKFIVANTGIGLTRVISKKRLKKQKIIITDGSTYAFLPDVIVDDRFYDVLPANKMNKKANQIYNIEGCTCDVIDEMARKRHLPFLSEGDVLAFMDVGAYSNVLASNFNTLKRAPMVMIKENGAVKIIRRRDRYSEMFAPELDVLKIAGPKEMKRFYDLFRINVENFWKGSTKKR
ncbi:TPA: diaminopimelate decarboxylase [Candidatus Woesearchaeota archaeon]|nr:diaminopimelate decarboxylase [Candidatus Woesearchaeota archaeon]